MGHDGSHGSPEVVLDGVGILFAPFLRDLLTYALEVVNEALGISTHFYALLKATLKPLLNKEKVTIATTTDSHFHKSRDQPAAHRQCLYAYAYSRPQTHAVQADPGQ